MSLLKRLKADSEIESRIMSAIRSGSPLGVIRLGDGEGLLLGWPEVRKNKRANRALNYQLVKWFGLKNGSAHQKKQMRSILRKAIQRANIIGVPKPRKKGLWSFAHKQIAGSRLIKPSHVLTDTDIHVNLHRSGALYRAILAAESVTIVTCRASVKPQLEAFTGKRVKLIQIPEGRHVESGRATPKNTKHWESRSQYRKACHTAGTQLVLVGGGVLGKIYTTDASRGGAVAIDIGSLFDGWAKFGSRSHLRADPDSFLLPENREMTSSQD